MAARRHQPKLALLVTILLLLLGVVAVISQDVEQEQHNVIKQEQLQHPQQHLSEGNGRSDEAGAPEDTRGAPVASQAEQPTDSQREGESVSCTRKRCSNAGLLHAHRCMCEQPSASMHPPSRSSQTSRLE